jgi:hypothetical protein
MSPSVDMAPVKSSLRRKIAVQFDRKLLAQPRQRRVEPSGCLLLRIMLARAARAISSGRQRAATRSVQAS